MIRHIQAYQHINHHHSILQTYQNIEICVMADVAYPCDIMYGIVTYFEGTHHTHVDVDVDVDIRCWC